MCSWDGRKFVWKLAEAHPVASRDVAASLAVKQFAQSEIRQFDVTVSRNNRAFIGLVEGYYKFYFVLNTKYLVYDKQELSKELMY